MLKRFFALDYPSIWSNFGLGCGYCHISAWEEELRLWSCQEVSQSMTMTMTISAQTAVRWFESSSDVLGKYASRYPWSPEDQDPDGPSGFAIPSHTKGGPKAAMSMLRTPATGITQTSCIEEVIVSAEKREITFGNWPGKWVQDSTEMRAYGLFRKVRVPQ